MTAGRLVAGLNTLTRKAGKPFRIKYFTQAIGSVWDDNSTLTQSGADLWISGIVLPLDTRPGSRESILVEQGKLIDSDMRLFMHGSVILTGSEMQVKIGFGSPVQIEFTTIGETIAPEFAEQYIYSKTYIRRLTNGSLLGE